MTAAFEEMIAGIENVADLKRRRNSRKGATTKAKTHLDTFNNYDRLDIADLQRRTENLAVFNQQYEILSERIAELEETDYDPDADVQIDENREILKIHQDKKIAYKGYCEYVELIEQLETI